jgi:hypothetical protein
MNSITAAKNRRANPPPPSNQNTFINKNLPSQENMENKMPNAPPLTLPQIIQSVDIRLTNLEKTVIELKTNGQKYNFPSQATANESSDRSHEFKEMIIDEFDKRYELLAQEIIELKDIVLKLQTFTMDVNKMLLEERNHIIDELEKKEQETRDSTFLTSTNDDVKN